MRRVHACGLMLGAWFARAAILYNPERYVAIEREARA